MARCDIARCPEYAEAISSRERIAELEAVNNEAGELLELMKRNIETEVQCRTLLCQGKADRAEAENKRLRRALEFYAGRLREDGNGYEFDPEPTSILGAVAREALGVADNLAAPRKDGI